MDTAEIVKRFMDADMQITESAMKVLKDRTDFEMVANRILENLAKIQNRPSMITAEIVSKLIDRSPELPLEAVELPSREIKPEIKPEEKLPELTQKKFRPLASDYDSRVEVLKDISGKSYCRGELKDFVNLFNSRFSKVKQMLRERVELANAISIGSLRRIPEREKVAVIGLVSDKRRYSTGNLGIEIEDQTGKVQAFVFQNESKVFEKAGEVVTDEVIGIIGSVRSGGGYPRIFVKDIIWPDLPIKREKRVSDFPLSTVMLSDLHVGSEKFLEGTFNKFTKWLREGGETKRDKELVGSIKYLLIAGDIVDGIGIYPEQIDELLISDINKQYETAAKLLAEVPDHIKIIICPGNHDAARPSEPQPAIAKDIGGALYDLNVKMVGNPALVSIEGVHFLAYHGRSFDDIVGAVPGLNRKQPTQLMIKLLQKRHLAPIYGGRVSISPEEQDMLVIEDIPDVLHCGHVHIYAHTKYRDVNVVNSGTFQGMTKFMQKMGVTPNPGHVPIINLQTHELEERYFGQSS